MKGVSKPQVSGAPLKIRPGPRALQEDTGGGFSKGGTAIGAPGASAVSTGRLEKATGLGENKMQNSAVGKRKKKSPEWLAQVTGLSA